MYRNVIIVLVGLLLTIPSFSQQNNIWYFGRNAGLDFNPNGSQTVPAVLADGAMDTNEGSASICDRNGKLLFYSNGVKVYNRLHQVMLNGDGLSGNVSTVQSCIIVPVPGNDSLFYLFVADALENSFANGYTYSLININLDNGNGAVISKNQLLWSSCTERLTAVRHANGTDVWVITNDFNSNIFRAWLVTCSGLLSSSVISISGAVLDQHYTINNGMMKVSPDSKQLCQTSFPEPEIASIPNFCQLFDFDNSTGIISNPRAIAFPNARIVSCEFSSDSRLLYLTNPEGKTIEQVEAKLSGAAAIISSRVRINTPLSGYFGIQLAPNGKIYLSQISSPLGVINLPNVKGAGCNYLNDQIVLSPGASYLSLPSYINDFSVNPDNGLSYSILDGCTGSVQFNGLTTMPGIINWQWDFGDGNTSILQNPVHTYTPANQQYTVKLKIFSVSGCGYIEKSTLIFPGGLALTADFDFVSKCDAGAVSFTNLSKVFPDTATVRYLWTFADGNTSTAINPVHSYASAGVYDVRLDVITSTACLNRSVTRRLNLDALNILASADQEIDPGQTVQLTISGGGSLFTWTPSTWLSDTGIANPLANPKNNITYKVVVRNDAGCSDSDYVNIKVRPLPGIYMPTGFTPNRDGLNDLIRPIITKEFTLQHFIIFNRWGQKIFETSEKGIGWNGILNGIVQDSGVFAWVINATDTRTNKKTDLKGTFVIVRR